MKNIYNIELCTYHGLIWELISPVNFCNDQAYTGSFLLGMGGIPLVIMSEVVSEHMYEIKIG